MASEREIFGMMKPQNLEKELALKLKAEEKKRIERQLYELKNKLFLIIDNCGNDVKFSRQDIENMGIEHIEVLKKLVKYNKELLDKIKNETNI